MAMTELVPGISMVLVDGQPGLPGRDSLAFTEVLGPLRRLSDLVPGMRSYSAFLPCMNQHLLHGKSTTILPVGSALLLRLIPLTSSSLLWYGALVGNPLGCLLCACGTRSDSVYSRD